MHSRCLLYWNNPSSLRHKKKGQNDKYQWAEATPWPAHSGVVQIQFKQGAATLTLNLPLLTLTCFVINSPRTGQLFSQRHTHSYFKGCEDLIYFTYSYTQIQHRLQYWFILHTLLKRQISHVFSLLVGPPVACLFHDLCCSPAVLPPTAGLWYAYICWTTATLR